MTLVPSTLRYEKIDVEPNQFFQSLNHYFDSTMTYYSRYSYSEAKLLSTTIVAGFDTGMCCASASVCCKCPAMTLFAVVICDSCQTLFASSVTGSLLVSEDLRSLSLDLVGRERMDLPALERTDRTELMSDSWERPSLNSGPYVGRQAVITDTHDSRMDQRVIWASCADDTSVVRNIIDQIITYWKRKHSGFLWTWRTRWYSRDGSQMRLRSYHHD